MKKILSALIALMLMLAAMAPALANTAPVVVGSSDNTGIDIVVVVDRSGTMSGSDPKGIALSAVKALADVSVGEGLEGTQGGVNIAFVPYGYSVLGENRFYEISDERELQHLMAAVDAQAKVTPNEDTNTGVALEKAYAMIQDRQNDPMTANHKFAVLLISDGEVDVGDSKGFKDQKFKDSKSREEAAEREIAASIQKGDDTAAALSAEGIKLHCIGIWNKDESKLGLDMKAWAEETGGIYETTNDINAVNDLMAMIYEEINPHVEVDEFTIDGNGGRFSIPEGVVQVNIHVRPSFRDASNCTIAKADGTPWPLGVDDIRQSTGSTESYTVIDMANPDPGDYTISIADGKQYSFDLKLFMIRDLKMELEPVASVANGDPCRIVLNVTKDGNIYYDPNGYQPAVTITHTNGNTIVNNDTMKWDAANLNYYYEFIPLQKGDYTIATQMVKDNLINISNKQPLCVTDAPVRPANDLGNIEFKDHAIVKYDANHTPSEGYAPYVIYYDDLERTNFSNEDGRFITGYTYAIDQVGAMDIVNDSAARTITITPRQAVNNANLEIRATFDGVSSEPVKGYISIEDEQEDVERSQFGNTVDGNVLAEIKGMLTGPFAGVDETLAVAVRMEGDAKVEAPLDDVEKLFLEPNQGHDGEYFTVSCEVRDADGNVSDGVNARIDGATKGLYVQGVTEGTYSIELTATSYDNSEISVIFELTVKDTFMFWVIVAAAVLVLILVIVLIIRGIIVGGKPAFARGMLIITIESDGDSEQGSAMLQRYGKKAVKMSTLCSSNGIRMGNMRNTLEKITVLPKKNGIAVHCNIKGLNKKDTILHSMDSRTIELDQDGNRIIELEYDEGGADY